MKDSKKSCFYFAGAIRGGRGDAALYRDLIACLAARGRVLTEHVGSPAAEPEIDRGLTDRAIHDRDLAWLRKADCVVAEVTTPSLGVGYEIACAVREGKPVLCLARPESGKRLSAMIAGCPGVMIGRYRSSAEACALINAFLDDRMTGPERPDDAAGPPGAPCSCCG